MHKHPQAHIYIISKVNETVWKWKVTQSFQWKTLFRYQCTDVHTASCDLTSQLTSRRFLMEGSWCLPPPPASNLVKPSSRCCQERRFVVRCTVLLVRVRKRIGNATASTWETLGEFLSHGPRNTGSQDVHHLWCCPTCTLMGGHATVSPWRVYRSSIGKMTGPPVASMGQSTWKCSTWTSMQTIYLPWGYCLLHL